MALVRAHRRTRCVPFIFGVAIPFFICTSTGMSCDFDVAQIYLAKKTSSNVSSERRRCFATYRRTTVRLYPAASFAKVYSLMHRETDVAKFFCECVNRMRTGIERRCGSEAN